MKTQQTSFTCGPASVINALRCYGIKLLERDARRRAKTDYRVGTTDINMVRALRYYGFDARWREIAGKHQARLWLRRQLAQGHPVICSVDEKEPHYLVALGLLGSRVVVFDCSDDRAIVREQGTLVYTWAEFAKRWGDTEIGFSGISVRPRRVPVRKTGRGRR